MGTGRLLLPLLERGLPVHGVDASEARLASCRARLRDHGRETELFRQNVVTLNLPFRYAAAFIADGSFQLLTGAAAALDALLRIRAHLVEPGLCSSICSFPPRPHPPGAAIVEVRTAAPAEGLQIALRPRRCSMSSVAAWNVTNRYERRDRTAIVAREDETRALTWYTEEEAVTLLVDAGYRDVRIEPAACARDDGRHFAVIAKL